MKLHQIILILFLLSVVQAGDCPVTNYTPSKKSDCTEHSKIGKYCCYVESNGARACSELDKKEYDEIGKWNSARKSEYEKMKSKIECESSYITFTLLSLILLIL